MIESAQYQEDGSVVAIIDDETWFISNDERNYYRQMLLKWQADGNIIQPYSPPLPQVPDRLSRLAFRLQLLADGKLDDVEEWVAQQDRATQISYQDKDAFDKAEYLTTAIFASLAFTPARVNAFYVNASQR